MEKIQIHSHHLTISLIFSSIFSLSVLAFVFCIIAEFKKSKVEDVKLDGKLCELPTSEAFGFGIAALVCFLTAQIVGNLIIFMGFWHGSLKIRRLFCQDKRPTIVTILLVISWLSFGIAVMLLSTAISMNKRQTYGKGWLNGECYLVKDGIFIGASILVLLSLGCTSAPIISAMKKKLLQISADQNAQSMIVPVR